MSSTSIAAAAALTLAAAIAVIVAADRKGSVVNEARNTPKTPAGTVPTSR